MKLIDKDAIITEIERRLRLLVPKITFHQQRVELENLLSFIDTLDVKEVDLEKEIDTIVDAVSCRREHIEFIAKRFFELGLRKKGE